MNDILDRNFYTSNNLFKLVLNILTVSFQFPFKAFKVNIKQLTASKCNKLASQTSELGAVGAICVCKCRLLVMFEDLKGESGNTLQVLKAFHSNKRFFPNHCVNSVFIFYET